MNIKTPHDEYANMSDRWELCRALYEGEHRIHEEGEKFLPRLQEETNEAYDARLKMTPLFNAYYRTISGLVGMMFRKPPEVVVPDALTDMLEDIDLAGTTLQGLARDVADEVLAVGRVGLLVDYPETTPGATRADAQRLNYRPMIQLYKAEAIYNWRTSRANGATVLSRVHLEEGEEVIDAVNEFKVNNEKRYRILDLIDGKYRQRLFKYSSEAFSIGAAVQVGGDIYPTMNGAPMGFIPFVVIGADCTGIDVEAPPLIDLATTNLHHYMQATSYERGCFFSGLPMYNIFGVNPENADGTPLTISIGGNIANIFPRPDAHAELLEVTSEFNGLRTNLEDKKREMAVLGARMLEQQKASVEASDTIARRQSGEESLLAATSQTISAGIRRALEWFRDWAGETGDIIITLNRDFTPAGMTAQDMTAMVGAWQSGAISAETLHANLQAGEIIADDVTFEIEQERINGAPLSFAGGSPQVDMAVPLSGAPVTDGAQWQPVDIEAIMQQMTEQHQAVLDQILQAISAQAQPAEVSEPDTGMADMMQAMGDQHAAGMAAIADAMGKEQPAPTINVAAPVVNVTPAAPPAVTVEAPVVNVGAPVINMPQQPITVNVPEQQPANVTVNNTLPEGKKAITVERDASGKIIGATAE